MTHRAPGTDIGVALAAAIALLALVLAAYVGVDIYRLAHPNKVSVWCDYNPDHDGYERSYEGPADQVLNACGVHSR
jgi:hypothetical protein